MPERWDDPSYDGRKLRSLVKRAFKHLNAESKKKDVDWDKFFHKLEALSRITTRHAKLIETSQLEQRTKNIERLLEYIKPSVIAEAKVKAGL